MIHSDSKHTHDTVSPPRPIFANANFLLLWCAYGISAFGDHLSEMALLSLQHAMQPDITDITRRTAIMLFVFMAPFVLFGPVFGWLADRLPRKWIMVVCCVARAGIMVNLLAILLRLHRWYDPSATISTAMPIEVAVLPLAALGFFAAVFSPARQALIPTIVDRSQLIRANASTAGLGMIASIASYTIGAWLVTDYGVWWNFLVTSMTFLLSAAMIVMIQPRPVHHTVVRNEQGVSALIEAFTYARTHRLVREIILISTLFWAAASVVRSIIPAIVKEVVGGSYQDIATYQGLLGVGLLAGSVVLMLLGPALKSELAISWCLKLAGFAGLLLTLGTLFQWSRATCGACIFLIGFFGSGIGVSVNAFLQRIVPDYLRGRVFGVNDLCSMAGLLLATGLLGIPQWPEIDRHISWIMALTSTMLVLAGILTTRVRLKRSRFSARLSFVHNANQFYCRLLPRLKREGPCTVPVQGPVIVVANHNSVLDPFLISAECPNRSIGFMIAREYAMIPVFRRLVEAIECIPVSRSGNDIASIKAVLRHLAQGKAIGIFPAGRIQSRDEPPDLHEGVGMMALRSGAPVIPVYIDGTRPPRPDSRYTWLDLLGMLLPFFQWHRARIRFGEPVDLSELAGREKDRLAHRAATEKIMAAILSLRTTSQSHRL